MDGQRIVNGELPYPDFIQFTPPGPSLYGLRGVGILLVLLAHSTGTTNFPQRLWFLEELGELGVLVFFVISEFLITTLHLRERAETGEISLRKFYIRRILRIFPVSIFLYRSRRALERFRSGSALSTRPGFRSRLLDGLPQQLCFDLRTLLVPYCRGAILSFVATPCCRSGI